MTEIRTRLAAALLVLSTAAPRLAAQETTVQNRSPDNPVVSVDFPGGTLADFVAIVRDAAQRSGATVNLLVAGPAERVALPNLTVRDADMGSLFDATRSFAEPDFDISIQNFARGAGQRILVVRVIEDPRKARAAQARSSDRELTVFPLRALTQTALFESPNLALSAETVLTAVQTATELADEGAKEAVIRFHEASGLLFFEGSQEQVMIAREVIDKLTNDMTMLRNREIAARNSMSTQSPAIVYPVQPPPAAEKK